MATKWKNTIREKWSLVIHNNKFIIGVLFAIISIALVIWMYPEIFAAPTKITWFMGLLLNIALGTATAFLTGFVLKQKYEEWIPADESFYNEWKTIGRKQQKTILIAAVIVLLAALLLYSMLARSISYSGRYPYYIANYSTLYLFIATVLIQTLICEICVIKYMKNKLNPLMDCMTQISQAKLDAALEIERESIEKATKSERLKVDLISNVSHDLKTPLTSMVGYIELMKKEELNDLTRDYVDVISDKAEKLKEMIESLFSLAKASSGNVDLRMEPINFNTLIEQIFADMSTQIDKSDLSFVQVLTTENTDLITDNIHMYRICQNLIENALKYSAPGTRVFVKTSLEKVLGKENVRLEITNTAGYMMDFDKKDIVERFARGDKSRTDGGNGLGLAIVSTYTSALGGSFDINIDCDQFKAVLSFPKGELQK